MQVALKACIGYDIRSQAPTGIRQAWPPRRGTSFCSYRMACAGWDGAENAPEIVKIKPKSKILLGEPDLWPEGLTGAGVGVGNRRRQHHRHERKVAHSLEVAPVFDHGLQILRIVRGRGERCVAVRGGERLMAICFALVPETPVLTQQSRKHANQHEPSSVTQTTYRRPCNPARQ